MSTPTNAEQPQRVSTGGVEYRPFPTDALVRVHDDVQPWATSLLLDGAALAMERPLLLATTTVERPVLIRSARSMERPMMRPGMLLPGLGHPSRCRRRWLHAVAVALIELAELVETVAPPSIRQRQLIDESHQDGLVPVGLHPTEAKTVEGLQQ